MVPKIINLMATEEIESFFPMTENRKRVISIAMRV
jgi:hypothetical protein